MKYTRIRKIINDNFNEKHKEKIENLEIINSYDDKEFYSYVKSIFKKEGYRRGGELWVEAVHEGQGIISFGSLKKRLAGDYNWMPEGYKVSIRLNYNAKIDDLSIQADCPKEYINIKYLKKKNNSSIYTDINKLKNLNENSIIEFKKMLLDHRLPLSNLILVAEKFSLTSDDISKYTYRILVECVALDRKIYEKINGSPRKNSIGSHTILTDANDILENLAQKNFGPTKDYVGSDSLVADLKKVFGSITLKAKTLLAFAGFLSPILVFLNIFDESNLNLNFAVSVWEGINSGALLGSIIWNFLRIFVVVVIGLICIYLALYLGSIIRIRYGPVISILLGLAEISFTFYLIKWYADLYTLMASNELFSSNTENGINNSFAGLVLFLSASLMAPTIGAFFIYKILLSTTYILRKKIWNLVTCIVVMIFVFLPGVSPIWNNNSWINCGFIYYADTNEIYAYKYIVGNRWQDKSEILMFPGSTDVWHADNEVKFSPGNYIVPNEEIESLHNCTGSDLTSDEVIDTIKYRRAKFTYTTRSIEIPAPRRFIYRFHSVTGFSKVDNESKKYWISTKLK